MHSETVYSEDVHQSVGGSLALGKDDSEQQPIIVPHFTEQNRLE